MIKEKIVFYAIMHKTPTTLSHKQKTPIYFIWANPQCQGNKWVELKMWCNICLLVRKIWKPGAGIIVLVWPGIDNGFPSNNGTSTDSTSSGAESISSSINQLPFLTALVNVPACHLNSPGVSVQM